ncbi:hypothetical protein NCHU2750_28280 [Neorhizobium sp. NCHU2750]|nr:hypothetical protein NCHU2750_28280 [Neorhizobium sp. NCHU2750]
MCDFTMKIEILGEIAYKTLGIVGTECHVA